MLRVKLWNKYFSTDADTKSINIMNPDPIYIRDNDIVYEHSLMVHKILFPRSSKRCTDTKIMSLLHGHDLTFNSFKHSLKLTTSSCCEICPGEKDDNKHKLIMCPKFNCEYRNLFSCIMPSSSLLREVMIQMDPSMLRGLRVMAQIILK